MKTCPPCNISNGDSAKFCSNCGASLGKEEIPKSKKKRNLKSLKYLSKKEST